MTTLGYIFLLLSIICSVLGCSHVFALLIISSIFQAGTVVYGISWQPYYFVALFFFARSLLEMSFKHFHFTCNVRGIIQLFGFCFLGVFSSFLFPMIFEGVFVYSPKYGLGLESDFRDTLRLNGGNIYQACLMMINFGVLFFTIALPLSIDKAIRSFKAAFYLLILILGIQQISLMVGTAFPYHLFNNDTNYHLANADIALGLTRPNGTFAEPSMAGPILSGFILGGLVRYLREGRDQLTLGVAGIGFLLVGSGAAIVGIFFSLLFLLMRCLWVDFTGVFNKNIWKRIVIISLFGFLTLFLFLHIPSVIQNLSYQLINKIDSQSFADRSTADLFSLQLLVDTYGVGVGLGSNRPSSLLFTILSTMGVAGLITISGALRGLFRNNFDDYYWLKYLAFGFFVNMVIGVPDISFPLLWVVLMLLVCAARNSGKSFRGTHA